MPLAEEQEISTGIPTAPYLKSKVPYASDFQCEDIKFRKNSSTHVEEPKRVVNSSFVLSGEKIIARSQQYWNTQVFLSLVTDSPTDSITNDKIAILRNVEIPHRISEDQLKRQKAIQLLESFYDEDPEEQKKEWEYLKKALDEDRLSDRKFFLAK